MHIVFGCELNGPADMYGVRAHDWYDIRVFSFVHCSIQRSAFQHFSVPFSIQPAFIQQHHSAICKALYDPKTHVLYLDHLFRVPLALAIAPEEEMASHQVSLAATTQVILDNTAVYSGQHRILQWTAQVTVDIAGHGAQDKSITVPELPRLLKIAE